MGKSLTHITQIIVTKQYKFDTGQMMETPCSWEGRDCHCTTMCHRLWDQGCRNWFL